MLAVAERYAQGIVWADDHKEDHTQELEFLKGRDVFPPEVEIEALIKY